MNSHSENSQSNRGSALDLLKLIGSLSSVLLSLFLFVVGNFFFTSLVSIVLQQKGYSSQVIGSLQSCFFFGLLIGALYSEKTVFRIGHIRSFTAGTALLVFSMLAMSFFIHPIYWAVMRFAAGISLAVMFIVIESWLLDNADETNRGAVLSIYMTFYYLSQTTSQWLYVAIKALHIDPFSAGAALCTLAIVPLSLTFTVAPEISELVPMSLLRLARRSPFGVASCIIGGVVLAMLYTYVPITGIKYGYDGAILISIVIAGGSILQYPIGKLSDIYERRLVLCYVALATLINSLLVYFSFSVAPLLYALLFSLGGLSFTLYPLGVSQSCDHINPKNFMQAAAALLIAYGIGSSFGPYLGAQATTYFSYESVFPMISIFTAILCILGLISMRFVSEVEQDDQTSFVVAATTGPLAATELQSTALLEEVEATAAQDRQNEEKRLENATEMASHLIEREEESLNESNDQRFYSDEEREQE